VLQLRNLMAGFSPRMSEFTPSAVHASFAVESVFNGFLSEDFRCSSSVTIPPVFHIHSCVVRRMDNGPLEVAFPGHFSTTAEN